MIRKLSLISLFTLMPASFYFAQTTVFAYVKDAQGKPVERAAVDLQESGDDVVADKIGYFQFVDMKPGQYHITVSRPGYESRVLEFEVSPDERRKDLGVISLAMLSGSSDAGVIVIDESAADDEGSSMQPTVGLLGASRDAFQNAAAFELGGYWFRPRGVDNRYEDVLFNGVSMSKIDDGRIDFSNWGGLNDVTRYPMESADNITPSEYAFGNLGGVVYYNTRASSYRKGVSLTYSATNRSYNNRLMGTYSTGLTRSGWAFTASVSRRWAEKGKIEGTYNDALAGFLAVEKKFSDRFAINLTGFAAPTYRATNSPNTQEVYDLMGKNYNSYWGWQDGKMRSSRIRKVVEPVIQLGFYNKLGQTSNWNNTFSYQFGSDSRSRLDWFHASDPNPTYYRRLPSFGVYTAQDWQQDDAVSQINWDEIYQANYMNSVDGLGNPHGAVYTMVADVNKDKTFNYVSHFDTRLQDNWKLNLNFVYQNFRSDNFRKINDLLGAKFAYNLDSFGNDQPYDVDTQKTQYLEGDRVQYSYLLNRNSYTFNASTEVDLPKWNVVASVLGAHTESQREGQFRNHFYMDHSKGKSAMFTGFDAGIKAKVTYKINGKNFIVYDGTLFSLSPTLNEIFMNPRVNDFFTPGLRNQVVNSNDLSFITRGQILKLRITGYWTDIHNATEISRYYAEGIQLGSSNQGQDAFVAEILSGANKTYKGIELGADVKITPTLNAVAVAAIGDYKYTNNPSVYLSADSDKYARGAEFLGKAQIDGYKVAGTPQKAFSLGLKYNSPKFWWVGASANYLMDQFLDFSVLNRTANFYTDPLTGDPYTETSSFPYYTGTIPAATPENVAKFLKQTKFDGEFMLNLNAGKSFLFGRYRMGVSVSVNNLLNNRNYVTGGFEQGRKSSFREAFVQDQQQYSYFAPKLWYDRGRTYFANVYFRF